MVTENTNTLPALLPDRHPQHDLFICDVADAVLKDVMQHMEHPFYSLSKKPETSIKKYRNGDHWLEITPTTTQPNGDRIRENTAMAKRLCRASAKRYTSLQKRRSWLPIHRTPNEPFAAHMAGVSVRSSQKFYILALITTGVIVPQSYTSAPPGRGLALRYE